MGKTGTVKHIHQYYRRHNGLWHCSGIEECTHYIPKNMPEPVGRRSLCWTCQEPFQLTPVNMIEDKPKCDKCLEVEAINEKLFEVMMPVKQRDRFEQISADALKKAVDEVRALKEKMAQQKPDEPDEIEVIEPDKE